MLRTQLAGQGIHFLVYVDDFLVVGDTLEKTLIKGMRALEELLDVLGLQWALHKRRGPARALEFLGILIANLPDLSRGEAAPTDADALRILASQTEPSADTMVSVAQAPRGGPEGDG
jgi:hypothetical protein